MALEHDLSDTPTATNALAPDGLLASLFAQELDAIVVTDADLTITEYGGSAERLYGWTRSEAIGQPWLTLVPTEITRAASGDVSTLLRAARDVRADAQVTRKDGTHIEIQVTATPVRDADGCLTGWLGIARARADVQEAVAEASAQRFRQVMESLIEGCMIVGRDWTYLFVNDTMASYCALPRARMVGQRMTDLFPGVEVTLAFSSYARCMAERQPQQFENAFTFPDGRVGWYEQRVYPIAEGVFVLAVDITARRVVEQALRESETKFRAVVENASDAINLLDLRTGRYVVMNRRQVALTGFTVEEMRDLPASEGLDRVHPDDRHISEELQRRVAAGEDMVRPVEYRWRVKSGEYRWFSDSRTLVRDDAGQPVALVGVSQDITERKQTEEAIREELRTNRHLLDEFRHRKTLSGYLSICMSCKKIHDADGRWQRLEEYISGHSDALLSHGLCPDCAEAFLAQDELR